MNVRDRIEVRLAEFGRTITERPWLFLLGSLIAVIVMVAQVPEIEMDTSAEGLLHTEDPALRTYEDFRRQFGRDQVVILGLDPGEVFEPGFLGRLREFHAALEDDVPYLDEVTSLVNAESIRGEGDDLIVEDLLDAGPYSDQDLKDLKQRVLSDPLYRNIIVSEDGSFTVIVIKPVLFSQTSGGKGIPLTEEEFGEFVRRITVVCDEYRSDLFPVYQGGDITVEQVLKDLTVNTMVRFTILTTLVIVAVFAFLFRTVSGVLLPLLLVNCALYSTLGLMAAFDVPITLNTTVLPSFLLAVGIGDSVHILAIYYKRLKTSGDRNEAISFALGHSGLAVVMTSMTTAGGLLSFVTSGIAPVANLGIFAAVGVMLALLFTLVTLPALLAVTPAGKRTKPDGDVMQSKLDGFLAGIGDIAVSHPRKVVAVSALLFAGSLALALQLTFSHNSLTYLREDAPVRKATETIDRKMKGSVNVEILVDTGKRYGLYNPAVMKKIEAAQHEAERMSVDGWNAGRASAVTDLIKDINRALSGGRQSAYQIPDNRELIAQELLLYEVGGGEKLDEIIDRDYRKARITVRMPWVDAVAYDKALSEFSITLKEIFAGSADATVTGLAAIIVRTLTTIIRSMADSYMIAGSVITLMMVLLIGNVRFGLCSMAPNFLPIVLGLGLMKMVGIPLDYSTIMVGGIAIGLAVDDTVHFMHNFRRYYGHSGDARLAVRQTLTTTGRAMLFTTIILGIGFFILLTAELKSTMNFGIITGFTICMALLADFFLAPAMVVLLTKGGRAEGRKG